MCTDSDNEHSGKTLAAPVSLHAGTKILKARFSIPTGSNGATTTLTLVGRSWAADSTAFCIPELSVGLDAGYVVSPKRMAHYLISHVHSDHIHMLTHVKSRSKPPQFVLPTASVPLAQRYLEAAQQMTSHLTPEEYRQIAWDKTHTYRGVEAGDSFALDAQRGLHVDVLHCDHGVPCVGYRLKLVKQKLRAEYAGLPGREIGRLRKQGVAVMEDVTTTLLTFLGDTHASIFEDYPDTVGDAPVLIVECSFLDPSERDRARATNHVHWLDLEPHVRRHPNTLFVLIHFSHRYSAEYVRNFFTNDDNGIPSNVLPWVAPASKDDLEECFIHS